MKKRNMLLALCAAALPLSGCAAMVTQKDLDAVNSRIQRNEQQIAALGGQPAGSASMGATPGQAEMWAQMQTMQQDLNMLRGQLSGSAEGASSPELAAQVNRLDAAVRKMGAQLAIPLPMLDASGSTYAGTPQTQAPSTPVTSSTPSSPSGAGSTATASTLYDSGTRAFSERRYSDAIQIFRDFVQQYPAEKLTSNAYFWQGESCYQLKDYNGAIQAYQQVIDKFPNSGKLQSAMFKQGVSFYNKGQKDAGKIRLNELIKNYPQAQEAERAKQFLGQNP